MRIAIVDDLKTERALLKERLSQQLALRGVEGKESALYCRVSGYLYGWHDGHGGGKGAAENRHGLPAGFYHDFHRPCAGGLSGAGAALSGEALF